MLRQATFALINFLFPALKFLKLHILDSDSSVHIRMKIWQFIINWITDSMKEKEGNTAEDQ